jgi:hypothetical protein
MIRLVHIPARSWVKLPIIGVPRTLKLTIRNSLPFQRIEDAGYDAVSERGGTMPSAHRRRKHSVADDR